MIKTGAIPLPDDAVTAEDEIKDPFVLEFLGLRDEYSESDLEDALIKLVEKVIGQTERITLYPDSGRVVPEFERKDLREIIHPPFRVVYRREKGKILIARTGGANVS